jgi:uncharacterized protein YkwD
MNRHIQRFARGVGRTEVVVALAIAAIGLSLIVVGSWRAEVFISSSSFIDVPNGHESADAITALWEEGIVRGYPDGTFGMQKTLTRAEFVTIVARAAGGQDGRNCVAAFRGTFGAGSRLLSDVPEGVWFEATLCTAMELGWITGFPDKTFKPERPVDLASAAKILSKAFKLEVAPARAGEQWFQPHLQALSSERVIPLTVTTPAANLTRLDMAELVYRLRFKVTDRPAQDPDAFLRPAAPIVRGDEELLLTLINDARSQAGVGPLQWHPTLQRIAYEHAKDMASRGYYSHVTPEGKTTEARFRDSGYLTVDLSTCNCVSFDYRYGENIVGADGAEKALQLWLASSVHKANILNGAFRETGIAHAGNAWVQTFGAIDLR